MVDLQKSSRVAIIDLGTNTIHLLIVESNSAEVPWKELKRERVYVKLATGGINNISKEAFQRAVQTMVKFKKIINQYGNPLTFAVGTACLRVAKNASDLKNEVYEKTGIRIQVISGDREAELITSGIILSLPEIQTSFLIMDIGGGSVEFIVCDKSGNINFSKSYPVGVAVLFEKFHKKDPISKIEIQDIDQYLKLELHDLIRHIHQYPSLDLVGASGTFEVLGDVLSSEQPNAYTKRVEVNSFYPFYEKVMLTNFEDRITMPEIPDTRADLIVVALQMIYFMLTQYHFNQILVSDFALKEGLLSETLYLE